MSFRKVEVMPALVGMAVEKRHISVLERKRRARRS